MSERKLSTQDTLVKVTYREAIRCSKGQPRELDDIGFATASVSICGWVTEDREDVITLVQERYVMGFPGSPDRRKEVLGGHYVSIPKNAIVSISRIALVSPDEDMD